MGKVLFSQCLSVHIWGGVPPSSWWGYPHPVDRGITPIQLTGGTPSSQCPSGQRGHIHLADRGSWWWGYLGYPLSGLDRGTPHQDWMGYPCQDRMGGSPISGTGWAVERDMRAVCLLRSRRGTFLFFSCFQLADLTKFPTKFIWNSSQSSSYFSVMWRPSLDLVLSLNCVRAIYLYCTMSYALLTWKYPGSGTRLLL